MSYEVNIEAIETDNGTPMYSSDGKLQRVLVDELPDNYEVYKELFTNTKRNKVWGCLRYHIYKDGQEILTLDRNYPAGVGMIYVVQHGKEFIITSGDYQTITIINLTDLTMESYCDDYRYKRGWAFCPQEFSSNYYGDEDVGDELELTVTGCYWGGETEMYVFSNVDLLNPDLDFSKAEWIPLYGESEDWDDDEDYDEENEDE